MTQLARHLHCAHVSCRAQSHAHMHAQVAARLRHLAEVMDDAESGNPLHLCCLLHHRLPAQAQQPGMHSSGSLSAVLANRDGSQTCARSVACCSQLCGADSAEDYESTDDCTDLVDDSPADDPDTVLRQLPALDLAAPATAGRLSHRQRRHLPARSTRARLISAHEQRFGPAQACPVGCPPQLPDRACRTAHGVGQAWRQPQLAGILLDLPIFLQPAAAAARHLAQGAEQATC